MKIAVICEIESQNGMAVRDALRSSGHDAETVVADAKMVSTLRSMRPHVAFDATNSSFGADGSIQEVLGALEIPCVGSSSHACRRSADSSFLSGVMESYWAIAGADLVASWPLGVCLSRDAFRAWGMRESLDLLEDHIPGGFPLCVKPAQGKGALRVDSLDELERALNDCFEVDSRVLVQQWIDGVMMEVFIIGNGWDAFALPPVEIADNDSQVHVPVRLSSLSPREENAQAIRAEIERAALEAYWAFGMRDYASIDVVWDGGQVRVLGVRSRAEMTGDSMFAYACKAAGLSVPAVLNELVDLYV